MSNIITGNFPIIAGTKAELLAAATAFPAGVYCYETDTNSGKIADGVTLYTNIAYHVVPSSAVLTEIGTLSALTTTTKTSLVGAVNELVSDYNTAVAEIPTQISQLINNSNFITAAGAPVQSVNGSTGAVNITLTGLGGIASNLIGVASGICPLDSSSHIAAAYLPSYVAEIITAANLAAFPASGNAAYIYVANDTEKTYRWSGSAYIEISPSPGSTDSVTEGSVNLYYTDTRARAAISATGSGISYNAATGVITYTQYSLPAATNSTLGGVSVSGASNLTLTSGALSLTAANVEAALGYVPGTAYSLPGATASVLGGIMVPSGANLTLNAGALTLTNANVLAAIGFTPSSLALASSGTPAALGTAALGSATTAAKADHVHAPPTAAQVPDAKTVISSASGAITVDASATTYLKATLTGAITSFTINNVPSTNATYTLSLRLIQGGSGSYGTTFTVNGVSVDWGANGAPTMSTAVGKSDFIGIVTDDGGATWCGFVGGLGY